MNNEKKIEKNLNEIFSDQMNPLDSFVNIVRNQMYFKNFDNDIMYYNIVNLLCDKMKKQILETISEKSIKDICNDAEHDYKKYFDDIFLQQIKLKEECGMMIFPIEQRLKEYIEAQNESMENL